MWIICSSNSYAQEIQFYVGSKATKVSKAGLVYDVVTGLTRSLRGKYHRVYMDNFYTSVPIFLSLLENCIYAVGTLRGNRKYIPRGIAGAPKKPKRGEHKTFQDMKEPNLTCSYWGDTKCVRYLSTCSNPTLVCNAVRRVGGTFVRISQPQVGQQYSKFMGAVDKFDSYRSSYPVSRNGKKMWRYLLFGLINCAIVNSWLLYSQTSTRQTTKGYSHMHFRHELALSLIGGYSCRQKSVKPQCYISNFAEENMWNHENVHMGARRVRRCVAHKIYKPNGKTVKDTAYGCAACNVFLCKLCHPLYHSASKS